tara:strand:+ start:170 stop:1090 length:921 start_codon:yes stop_codon:yes gene_type:complete
MIVHAHPTDIEHYDATIKAKVDVKRIKDFVTDTNILNRLSKNSYSIWGIAPGPQNTKKFDKIMLGDICLMYYKQKFHTVGKIIATFNNHDFAKELWGIKDDRENTWEHMFVIDDLRDINIKLEEFNNTVKTQNGNYYKLRELRGFISLNEENSQSLIEKFSLDKVDSKPPIILQDQDYHSYEMKVKKHINHETDIIKTDPSFINKIKKERDYTCEACGFRYDKVYGDYSKKKDFIEAHHIIPKTHVKKMVKKDTKLIRKKEDFAILCANCHRMIHRMMNSQKTKSMNLDDFKKRVSGIYIKLLGKI